MKGREEIIRRIRTVFRANEHPGDAFLQGSLEGCEPCDEVSPFRGRKDWEKLDSNFLDAHASALSFFSEAGLHYFLPAYLIADVQGELKSADPVIPLTYAFSDLEVRVTINNRDFVLRTGKSELLNPQRYGAATSYDYARSRLSIFTREEARAIVAYLEFKRDVDPGGPDRSRIDAALDGFWKERAAKGPTSDSLRRHVKEKEQLIAASKMR